MSGHNSSRSDMSSSSSSLSTENDSVHRYFDDHLDFVADMKSTEEMTATLISSVDGSAVRVGEAYAPETYYIEYLRNKLGLVQSLADNLAYTCTRYKARLELADKAINELQVKSRNEKENTIKWIKVAEESKEEMLKLLAKSNDKLEEAIALGESAVDQSLP